MAAPTTGRRKLGSISGRVRDVMGVPLDSARVTATSTAASIDSSVTTGADGIYKIKKLPPRAYVVSVRPPSGFSEPPPVPVDVKAGTNISDVDFRLVRKPVSPTGPGVPGGVTLPATPTGTPSLATPPVSLPPTPTLPGGSITLPPSPTGPPGITGPPGPLPPVVPIATGGTVSTSASSIEVDEFLRFLLGDDLNIETPIAEDEALEAIALFSISNVLLAGLGRRKVGNEEKTDVLGILTLYYGLQDKSLGNRIVVDSRQLWRAPMNGQGTVEDELKSLRDALDNLGQDVNFVSREAKRQFNLGLNNDVAANVAFPRLMRRYTDIATDPRLTLNLREEEQPGSFTSKDKVSEAYDLLSELKAVALQVIRSLSKYGTIATRRANRDWAQFETRAFRVLKKVAEQRFTEDVDEKRILSVVADLLDKSFERVISPYFALARNGGSLLALAFETYQSAKGDLGDFDRDHLLNVFQRPGPTRDFLTTRMRNQALVLKRYPLAAWN